MRYSKIYCGGGFLTYLTALGCVPVILCFPVKLLGLRHAELPMPRMYQCI